MYGLDLSNASSAASLRFDRSVSYTHLVSSFEPYATSWTLDLVRAATADAKAQTGVDQRITALSTDDGYGSSAIHRCV